jgi:hypothetical protein
VLLAQFAAVKVLKRRAIRLHRQKRLAKRDFPA